MAVVLSFINKSKFDRLKISYDVKKSFKNLFLSSKVLMFIILLCSMYLITEAANQIAIHLELIRK